VVISQIGAGLLGLAQNVSRRRSAVGGSRVVLYVRRLHGGCTPSRL